MQPSTRVTNCKTLKASGSLPPETPAASSSFTKIHAIQAQCASLRAAPRGLRAQTLNKLDPQPSHRAFYPVNRLSIQEIKNCPGLKHTHDVKTYPFIKMLGRSEYLIGHFQIKYVMYSHYPAPNPLKKNEGCVLRSETTKTKPQQINRGDRSHTLGHQKWADGGSVSQFSEPREQVLSQPGQS